MNDSLKKINRTDLLQIFTSVVIIIAFFLPWVIWDGTTVKGVDMPLGNFFKISETKFEVSNPFPKLSFLFYLFWLIPILAFVTIGLTITRKKTVPFSFFLGAMVLGLVTVYILFTKTLIDLGAGNSLMPLLKPVIWLEAAAALLLILTATFVKNPGWKIGWLLIGPVLAFASFKIGEKYVLGQTHQETKTAMADYSLSANALITEFLANDTAANKKYREKMLVVDGVVSAIDLQPDSSATIKFADTTGSYAIFSFEKEQLDELKNIKAEELVSLKGVCSGSIFSDILGTTSISFKRSTINKK